jgi:hypothetical protein
MLANAEESAEKEREEERQGKESGPQMKGRRRRMDPQVEIEGPKRLLQCSY